MYYLIPKSDSLALDELLADPMYPYLDEAKIQEIIEDCTKLGQATAMDVFTHGESIEALIEQAGIRVTQQSGGADIPEFCVFSEYYQGRKEIIIYPERIRSKLVDGSREDTSFLEEAFLVHEYFHYLETTSLGITFQRYRINYKKIGPFQCRSYVRAASEIAAHSFVQSYFQIKSMAQSRAEL